MLQPGSTYLLPTRYSEKENRYHVNSFPGVAKLISNNPSLTDVQLRTLAESDLNTRALWKAYPNEILLVSDIARNDTRNSYQSLTEVEKVAVQAKIASFSPSFTSPPPAPVSTSTATSTASSTGN